MADKKNYCIACPKNKQLNDTLHTCEYEDSPKCGFVYTVKSIACVHFGRLVLANKAREDYEAKQKKEKIEAEHQANEQLELEKKEREVQVWMQEHPGQGPVHSPGYEEAIAQLILKYPPPLYFQAGMKVEYPPLDRKRKDGP